LSRHRRADDLYTLNCEEPDYSRGVSDQRSVCVSSHFVPGQHAGMPCIDALHCSRHTFREGDPGCP
ncbi:hypothetical protein DIQ79_33650, partial [Mycolicibacterium smegmatis]